MGTVLGEGVADDAEGVKGHNCANRPEPVGAAMVDVDASTERVVEDIWVLDQGCIAPFVEV